MSDVLKKITSGERTFTDREWSEIESELRRLKELDNTMLEIREVINYYSSKGWDVKKVVEYLTSKVLKQNDLSK